MVIALLLLMAGIEINPGPATSNCNSNARSTATSRRSEIRLGSLNAGGATTKAAVIDDMIRDNRLDILAVCESWVLENAPNAIKYDLAPDNYSVLHVHRQRSSTKGQPRRGGGLAFIYSNQFSARPIKCGLAPKSFELQLVGLQVGNIAVKVANIYRPPRLSKSDFLDEFADLLTSFCSGTGGRHLICGDFNMPGSDAVHIDERLSSLLDIHGYQQHVTQSTRHDPRQQPQRRDNLLDLVISSTALATPLVSGVNVLNSHGASDHDLVVTNLSVMRHKPPPTRYTYRDIKKIDIADFDKRLQSSDLFTDPAGSPDAYLAQFETAVTTVLNQVAPLKFGHRSGGRRGARWLDPEAIIAKQRRRQLERRWKKTGSEVDRRAYRDSCRHTNKAINASRNRYRCQRIIDAGNNARQVWANVKDLLHTDHSTGGTSNDTTFCSKLATFFVRKVNNIKATTAWSLAGLVFDPLASDRRHQGPLLSAFTAVTDDEVAKLIASMPAKSSPLDFVPTSLLKACRFTFAHVIARLANLSFEHSTFPTNFKTASVTPLLKKPGLDADDPVNYRPISNLNTVSKVLERLVLSRVISHVSSSPSFDAVQSAYRRQHSTETALLKITNDIYTGFDTHQSTILAALDQSAAFDCIDHEIMISRLQHTFGVTDQALSWFVSYFAARSMFVRRCGFSSALTPCDYGVPQGSALGPLCFNLYVAPLSCVIGSFGVRHHQYADDTQMYIAASKAELDVNIDMLEKCTAAVHQWLLHNGLQLNPSKSEVIQFTAGRCRELADDISSLQVSDAAILPSPTIKTLGVTLDRLLTFDEHVASVCKACYFHIRALRHVRQSLPDDVAKIVACSIVHSRLDYCNSLFVGMADRNFKKLQRVQNTLARVVLRAGKFEHITPALIQLHWLPVKQRALYKLDLITFNVLQYNNPMYLRDLLTTHIPCRNLRSSSQHLLSVGYMRTVSSSRCFKHSAAVNWNHLPYDIRACDSVNVFKRKLKAHLFDIAYTT